MSKIETLGTSGCAAPCLTWFAYKPVKLMPYLDSAYLYGNDCIEPNAIISCDPISTGAQIIKTNLAEVGLTYSIHYGFNFSDFSGDKLHDKRRSMTSHNLTILSNLDIFRNNRTGDGLFLSIEFKTGNGFGYNEGKESAQKSIGSLTSPNQVYEGPRAHFENISLVYACLKGKLAISAGMVDNSLPIDRNSYANLHYTELINNAFVNNICLPMSKGSMGFNVAWQPTKSFYMMVGTGSNNTPINHNPFKYMNMNAWTTVTEFGYVAEDMLGMGQGIYRLEPYWLTHQGKDGYGICCNFQQQLGQHTDLGWFLRAGWADKTASKVTGITASVSTGLAWRSPFGETDRAANKSYMGLGFVWAKPSDHIKDVINKNEYGVELSYVMQLTPTMTLQPDIQIIKDPIHGKKGQTNVVFQLQNYWHF